MGGRRDRRLLGRARPGLAEVDGDRRDSRPGPAAAEGRDAGELGTGHQAWLVGLVLAGRGGGAGVGVNDRHPWTPGIDRSLASTVPGTVATAEIGWPEAVALTMNESASTSLTPPRWLGAPWSARIVVVIPTATLVMNKATMSPLIERNAARGLSPSRRPAMSAAGLLVCRARTCDPTMVSHGPAMTTPTIVSRNPRK